MVSLDKKNFSMSVSHILPTYAYTGILILLDFLYFYLLNMAIRCITLWSWFLSVLFPYISYIEM